MPSYYPFEKIDLPYSSTGLERVIDKKTLEIHYNKLYGGYINKLNTVLKPYECYYNWTIKKLLKCYNNLPCKIQKSVKDYAGGVSNHEIYFLSMSDKKSEPESKLEASIKKQFCSFENLKKQFKEMANSFFGSGYVWLCADCKGNLYIKKTSLQDSVISMNLIPLICIDLWEHSYFIRYENRRDEYIDNWFEIINWQLASENYSKVKKMSTE